VAAALKRALEMPLEERCERHGPMLEHLLAHDVEDWAEDYLSALAEAQERPGLLSGLRALFNPAILAPPKTTAQASARSN